MSAVHANMSNTLNTPIEAMEISYPLRVERYELRDGSSGAGDHPGGLGIIRAISPVGHEARVSLQSDRRRTGPYGLHGGQPGQPGANWHRDTAGGQAGVAAKCSFSLAEGEAVQIDTPGGGGWNRPV
jgi:N-methylhydantoinase B